MKSTQQIGLANEASRSEDTVRLSSDVTIADAGYTIAIDVGYVTDAVRPPRHIERAVYSYIQAKRSLGETVVNTADIARALEIPLRVVELVIHQLQPKGVRRRA